MIALIATLLVAGLCVATQSFAAEAELFILWGLNGRWDGQLEVSNGKLNRVLTYSFEQEYGDQLLSVDETKVSWKSGVGKQFDGLHLFVEGGLTTVLHVRTPYGERDLKMSDFPADKDAEIVLRQGKQFLVIGRGDPAKGPKNPSLAFPIPPIYQSPKPVEPVRLPDGWWKDRQTLQVALAAPVTATPTVRRVSNNDGRLYLEVANFTGKASFKYGQNDLGTRQAQGALWVSLEPRIARLAIEVTAPLAVGGTTNFQLSAATTLVETRKTKLYVNGEPFLVKGTLPRDLNDTDAAYLKALGANTLRGWVSPEQTGKHGFMLITSLSAGPSHICNKPLDDAEFRKQVGQYLERMYRKAPAAMVTE